MVGYYLKAVVLNIDSCNASSSGVVGVRNTLLIGEDVTTIF